MLSMPSLFMLEVLTHQSTGDKICRSLLLALALDYIEYWLCSIDANSPGILSCVAGASSCLGM